jgi:AraC-like DNA-binding protein
VGDKMIKNLKGEYETVEFAENLSVILYENSEYENYPIHWHNAIEIIMPVENNYTVVLNQNTYKLNENDIIIIPPGELHQLYAPETGKRFIFLCDANLIYNNPALSSLISCIKVAQYISPEKDKIIHSVIKKLFLDINYEFKHPNVLMEALIYSKIIQMLIEMSKNNIEIKNQKSLISSEKVNDYSEKFNLVTKYIYENFMYDITLDKLASIAGYSRFHFSRLFKEYYSVSYIEYINEKRIKSAENLLLDQSLSITEVAMKSGFSSISTFNRIFKEIKHCTPSDFRKLYKASNH